MQNDWKFLKISKMKKFYTKRGLYIVRWISNNISMEKWSVEEIVQRKSKIIIMIIIMDYPNITHTTHRVIIRYKVGCMQILSKCLNNNNSKIQSFDMVWNKVCRVSTWRWKYINI